MKGSIKKRSKSIYNARITVAEYAWRWLSRKMPSLKPSTRVRYSDHVRQICEGLGHLRMADLAPGEVADWLTMLREHFSGWTCNGILRVLRVMTRDAKADLRLVHWACDRVTGPRLRNRYSDDEPNALTAGELARMLAAMREHQPEWFSMFATMALTGIRFGEAAALQWRDIDFEVGKLTIRRNVVRGMIGSTKTEGSKRPIPLVAELTEILRAHERRVHKANPTVEWVFASCDGKPCHTGALAKPIRRAASLVGLNRRITAQGLRRTLNTLALEVAPAEVIRLIMGHVTTEMTTHYNAANLDARRDVLTRVTAKIEMPRAPTKVC